MKSLTLKLTGKRVLIVEDYYLNRELAHDIFETMECVVDTAEDAETALNLIKNNIYDLIVMDVHMPVMDGYQLTKKIREIEKSSGKHTPIIAFTACAMEGDKQKCLDAGMDEYLTKPIDFVDLDFMLKRIFKPK